MMQTVVRRSVIGVGSRNGRVSNGLLNAGSIQMRFITSDTKAPASAAATSAAAAKTPGASTSNAQPRSENAGASASGKVNQQQQRSRPPQQQQQQQSSATANTRPQTTGQRPSQGNRPQTQQRPFQQRAPMNARPRIPAGGEASAPGAQARQGAGTGDLQTGRPKARVQRGIRGKTKTFAERVAAQIASQRVACPLLKDSIRDEIFTLHSSDSKTWDAVALSKKFSVSVARVQAIIMLKTHAIGVAVTDPVQLEERRKFDAVVRKVAGEADFVYDDPVNRRNYPPKMATVSEVVGKGPAQVAAYTLSPLEEATSAEMKDGIKESLVLDAKRDDEERKKRREAKTPLQEKVVDAFRIRHHA